ncbi:MAG: hypothetical protein ACOCWO_02360 [Candidatus Muiribacteriaceae bacterium]
MKRIAILTMLALSITCFSQVYFIPEPMDNMPTRNTGFSRNMSCRNNVPQRINSLIDELKITDEQLTQKLNNIAQLIVKNWYLNSEFEADRNIMLNIFRESLDEFSNLNDRLHGLELELFNPEELPFSEAYSLLDNTTSLVSQAYKALDQGKSGLREAKTKFGKAHEMYESLSEKIMVITDVVSGAVPYNEPAPAPAPDPGNINEEENETINYNAIEVEIDRKKIKLSQYDIINPNEYEGKLVLKKSKERLHELSTLDRWMYRQALDEAEGYHFAIVKHTKDLYSVYWWHVADEIAGIVNDIKDIFE